MKAVLGIDSSCYTTSCALVSREGQLLSAQRELLKVGQGERGLRQSEAVFLHVRQLPEVLARTLKEQDAQIAAICASDRPVDNEASYMPVFQAGRSLGASLAAALRVPLFTCSHQQGHLAAAAYGLEGLPAEHLALHLSGGTTDLLRVDGSGLTALGRSLDLHAGQLVDRVGVALGLPFPAGPALEALAAGGKASGRYSVSLKGGDCHLSGAETQALRDIEAGELPRGDIAAEVFDLIARTVLKQLRWASEQTGLNSALVFGGVASSSLLRALVADRAQARRAGIDILWGRPELSGDNAVGAALIGARNMANI